MSSETNHSIQKLFHVEPIAGNAEEIHSILREKNLSNYYGVVDSIEETLEVAGYDINFAAVRDKLDQVDSDRSFSTNFYIHHSKLTGAMNAGDVKRVIHELGRLRKMGEEEIYRNDDGDPAVSSAGTHEWEDYAVPIILEETPNTSYIYPISDKRLNTHQEEVNEALELIADVEPVLKEEIEEYAEYIKLFSGRDIVGVTGCRFFGTIFLNAPSLNDSRDERIAYFIEHIVHEAAHLHGSALEIHDEFVLNPPEERFNAPIRPDPRPMSGIFHATFVLSRITGVFKVLAERTGNPVFEEFRDRTKHEWRIGYDDVVEHGDMTELGKQISTEFEPLADRGV